MTSPAAVVRSILTWPTASQQRSRRNALIASTALAQLRRERLEVEEFLDRVAAAAERGPMAVGAAVQQAVESVRPAL